MDRSFALCLDELLNKPYFIALAPGVLGSLLNKEANIHYRRRKRSRRLWKPWDRKPLTLWMETTEL